MVLLRTVFVPFLNSSKKLEVRFSRTAFVCVLLESWRDRFVCVTTVLLLGEFLKWLIPFALSVPYGAA